MVYENVLQVIGNTPIVRLNRVTQGLGAQLFAKLEFMNPGGSIKDRIGAWMIEDAERNGQLKPGGTILEGTHGNPGVGLAIAAAIKGYKFVFVLPDKMSLEKIWNLKKLGAQSLSSPLQPLNPMIHEATIKYQGSFAQETPNAVYLNQYDNLSNRDTHYK